MPQPVSPMRSSFLGLLVVPLLILSALAQEPPKPGPPAHPVRQTWEQHFIQANLAHDGHLTLEEAKGGDRLVAKHFDDIDVDHKGYVTQNDIRAWRIMRKEAHRLSKPREDKLKPRNAFQLRLDHPPASTKPTSTGPASLGQRTMLSNDEQTPEAAGPSVAQSM
jgi:hypothetical protein